MSAVENKWDFVVFYFIFQDCVLLKKTTVYETRKKNDYNSLRGKRSRKGTMLYKPAVWHIQFHMQRERLSSYMATYSKLPYSALLPSKWNAHISFPNYWVALFVNSNYKVSIYMPIYVHKGHYKNSISCYPTQMFVRTYLCKLCFPRGKPRWDVT